MESTTTTPSGALLARLTEKGALTSDTELTSHDRDPTNDIGRRADVIALTAYELFETETLAAGVARGRGSTRASARNTGLGAAIYSAISGEVHAWTGA